MRIKKMFLLISLLIATNAIKGQFVNNSSCLVFRNGVNVIVKGSFINKNNGSILSLLGTSMLSIGGDISNNGADSINFTGIDVSIKGESNSSISGLRDIVFENLAINKSITTKIVKLERSIFITNEFQFISGLFDIRDFDVSLGSNGRLLNEDNDSRIISTDGTNEGYGNGRIISTPVLVSGSNLNVSGMGIDVISTSFSGTKTIVRGHHFQFGTGSCSSNKSIYRYFLLNGFGEVSSSNYIKINYFENELNGHIENELIMYQSLENEIDHQTRWTPLNTTITASSDYCETFSTGLGNYYTFDISGNNGTSGFFTIGSNTVPLPINLLQIEAHCIKEGVSINWITISETNNNYFTIEKSFDGINFEEIAQISGAETSNQTIYYKYDYITKNQGVSFYRLSQTDFNGTTSYSKAIPVLCSQIDDPKAECNIYTPDNQIIIIDYTSPIKETLKINIINNLGQVLFAKNEIVLEGLNRIEISNLSIPSGVYITKVISDNQQFANKILLINR